MGELDRTLTIMDQLLGSTGCPWTKAQTHETLAQYAVEEAHELADAIAHGEPTDICEELGDLWLQVAYHAAIAETFGIEDVAKVLNDKLIRRHPHVFGDLDLSDPMAVADNWDEIKAQEKADRTDPFEGISVHLSPLLMAAKVRWRGRDHLPIPDSPEALAALQDALDPVKDQSVPLDSTAIGNLLAAVVTLAVSADIDPDMALRQETVAYQKRVRERLSPPEAL